MNEERETMKRKDNNDQEFPKKECILPAMRRFVFILK